MSRTSQWYDSFSRLEARGQSALYEEWATGVSTDSALLALLDQVPLPRRQPNLLFAVSRLLGAPERAYPQWRQWVESNWPDVRAEMLRRSTQTNEARRCAALVVALARIEAQTPGPIALLEVGASAGLCLFPDRYSYHFTGSETVRLDPADGESPVLIECAVDNRVPLPAALPTIVWRAGIDLNPLDVRDADDRNWLETLIWPEQHDRRSRLAAAMHIVAEAPPHIIQGDAVDSLAALAARAPADATLVIVSMGVLVYLDPADRARFAAEVAALDARWISNEGMRVLDGVSAALPPAPPNALPFVLAVDGHPLAWSAPHGQSLEWIAHWSD